MISKSILNTLQLSDNDYSKLEKKYFEVTSSPLVSNPFQLPPQITKVKSIAVSVVIAGWNVRDSIIPCLTALEQSSFNLKSQNNLQVIFVDDGSTDNTWELINQTKLSLHLTCIKIAHSGQAKAMNIGASKAKGDLIIFCDADMILNYYTLEHFAVRHQVVPNAILVGFRSNISRSSISLENNSFFKSPRFFQTDYVSDERITYPTLGYPINMCLSSHHFKRFGFLNKLWMPNESFNDPWLLPDMVFGALFCISKKAFYEAGGYDERFTGWGCTDTYLAAKAISLGLSVIPIYSASGYHINHPFRTSNKQQEYLSNRKLFKKLIKEEKCQKFSNYLGVSNKIIEKENSKTPQKNPKKLIFQKSKITNKNLIISQTNNLLCVGDYGNVIKILTTNKNSYHPYNYLVNLGDSFYGLKNYSMAIDCYQEAMDYTKDFDIYLKIALAFAANDQFSKANIYFKKGLSTLVNKKPYRYYLNFKQAFIQGLHFFKQGYYDLAKRCFETSLAINTNNIDATKYRQLIINAEK